jgi:hypothetical protein
MGLLDALGGGTAARGQVNARVQQLRDRNEATRRLEGGFGNARDAILSGTQDAGSALRTGLNLGGSELRGGRDLALANLTGGFDTARGDIMSGTNAALSEFDPVTGFANRVGGGTDLYLDALGVRGPEGNQRAVEAFQAGPGFNFALDQGIDAISRRRAAQGLNDSGNADRDATAFATGLANQEFGSFLDRLGGLAPLELAASQGAAAGRAGLQSGQGQALADLASGQGLAAAGLEERTGQSLAGLAERVYGNQANLQASEGRSLADLFTREGVSAADVISGSSPGIANTFIGAANAKSAGAGNIANLGINTLGGIASILEALPE